MDRPAAFFIEAGLEGLRQELGMDDLPAGERWNGQAEIAGRAWPAPAVDLRRHGVEAAYCG